jgi:hypothetical protein
MKLKIYIKKEIDELIMFDNTGFKKVLKPIKTSNTEKFLDNLIDRAHLLLSCLNRGFDLADHDKINLSCSLTCNIPITFTAQIGHGMNCWISGYKSNGESFGDTGIYKEELLEYLESITLPTVIVFKTFELSQKIGKSESKFTFSIDR